MQILIHFIPIFLFIALFVDSGIYFTLLGTEKAFYQLSPITTIIPAVALAWGLRKENTQRRMEDFLEGVRHKKIITMFFIFLLAGAFNEVTRRIGSLDTLVHCAMAWIPTKFLLVGMFLAAAFVSTSVGTSMGTIATIAPIGVALRQNMDISSTLAVATVVGGAMLGDNLSMISGTTIASVMSQSADPKQKLWLNSKTAGISAFISTCILSFQVDAHVLKNVPPYNMILIFPYILLLILSISGTNVFVYLCVSLACAGCVGLGIKPDFNFLTFSQALNKGFESMHEIMLLSLLVGGLLGLIGKDFLNK